MKSVNPEQQKREEKKTSAGVNSRFERTTNNKKGSLLMLSLRVLSSNQAQPQRTDNLFVANKS